jgi:hypothetical protein
MDFQTTQERQHYSSPGDRAKKKYVCLWSPDRPYFVADDPNVFNRQLFDPNFS